MDVFKADKIRKAIRLAACACGLGAAATAFIFGILTLEKVTGLCMTARVLAIIMFVCSVGVLVFDLITKAFSPVASGIGAAFGLIGFIGNFLVAPASTMLGLLKYSLAHMKSLTEIDTTQLSIGRYMIILAGVLTISYNFKCFKSGT